MLHLLKNTNYDFLSKRHQLLVVSVSLALLSLVVVVVRGVNWGIEFTGGTELQLKFKDPVDIGAIRSALASAGLNGASVTTVGEPTENEIYIRLNLSHSGTSEDLAQQVRDVIERQVLGWTDTRPDLNSAGDAELKRLLAQAPGVGSEQAERAAVQIVAARKDRAILRAIDDLASLPDVTPEIVQHLQTSATVGPLAVRGQSFIGPAIGSELLRKALFAVVGSLAGMLAYIWFRFQFQYGLAAVVALIHDTIITLGLFVLLGEELSLPVVAAFLTLIGYSVNDTVVVFDRIRENLAGQRVAGGLEVVINTSINQTLSRTIITSGLTWLAAFALYLFGGPALRPFSFVLTVGVIVGTYSSIYIAMPFLVVWKHYLDRRQAAVAAKPAASPAARKAKKVRSS